jgi:hypothetical protein
MRSEVLRFVDLIDELDEKTVQLIEYSIEGLEEDFGVFKLVEALARLVTKQPSLVGRIFMRLIGQGLRPIYKREAIEMIVDGLYQNGETHVADQVCNDYGKNGIFFLRPIYERNQPMS